MPASKQAGIWPEQSFPFLISFLLSFPHSLLYFVKGANVEKFIQQIKNNFFRESISFSLSNLTTDGLTITGGTMRSFTLAKNQVLQSAIEVSCLPDLSGNPHWCIELGNHFTNGLHTQIPIPHDGIIDTSGTAADTARFTYLLNNLAHYIVKIKDQSVSNGSWSADFSECLQPIGIGHFGRRTSKGLAGGFEYLVPMVPGDKIKICVIDDKASTPKAFTLEATHVGLQVRSGIDRPEPPSSYSLASRIQKNGGLPSPT